MHRETFEELVNCADCGAALDVSRERGFGGDGWSLCWGCALKRGGNYDEDEDRWGVEPNTADLDKGEHLIR